MAKYISKTGKDIIFRFKNTSITIPKNSYVDINVENLDTMFPNHIIKYKEEDEPKYSLYELPKLTIQDINSFGIKAIDMKLNIKEIQPFPINNVNLKLNIDKIDKFVIKDINIKSNVDKVDNSTIKDIILKDIIIEKEVIKEKEVINEKVINRIMDEEDSDVNDFLNMIKKIIKE